MPQNNNQNYKIIELFEKYEFCSFFFKMHPKDLWQNINFLSDQIYVLQDIYLNSLADHQPCHLILHHHYSHNHEARFVLSVHLHLCDYFITTNLVPAEFRTIADNVEHLIFGDVTRPGIFKYLTKDLGIYTW